MNLDAAFIRAIEKAALAFTKKCDASATYEFLRTRDAQQAAKVIRAIVGRASKNPAYTTLLATNREVVIIELGMQYATHPDYFDGATHDPSGSET